MAAFLADNAPGLNVTRGEVDFISTLGRMHAGSTKLAGFGLRVAIWMVTMAPLWLFGRFAMFGGLARTERTELLRRLLAHKLFAVRELTLLLKLTAAMALLGTASVRARSHYDDVSHAAAPSQAAPKAPLQDQTLVRGRSAALKVLP